MSFNYEEMRSSFTLDCPENFNFAFDVLAQKALQLDKPALISIDNQGNHIRDISYNEIDEVSSQTAHALLSLGISKADNVLVILPRIPDGIMYS